MRHRGKIERNRTIQNLQIFIFLNLKKVIEIYKLREIKREKVNDRERVDTEERHRKIQNLQIFIFSF